MVYYGNTKEDAEKIGFRDNLIYEYLEGQSKTTNKEDILKIIAMDREETIKTFQSYQNKSENKTMYSSSYTMSTIMRFNNALKDIDIKIKNQILKSDRI